MLKGFGDLLGLSWSEFKGNFWNFAKVILLFSFIPFVLFGIIGWVTDSAIFLGFSSIITMVLYFVMAVSLIYMVFLKPEKINVKDSIKGGMNFFWRYIWLSIIMLFLLALLFLLLIVPGIIFLIYWTFASYILIWEDKSAWESMKRSKEIIKGKWWRTFSYMILLGIIIVAISFVFSIPSLFLGEKSSSFMGSVIVQLGMFITTPLSLLFTKNLYLDMKHNIGASSAKPVAPKKGAK